MFRLKDVLSPPLLLITLFIFLCVAAPEAQSQDADILNKKLRISAPSFDSAPIKGWPVNVTADTLVLRDTHGNLIRIPVSAVERCEMAAGKSSHAGTGIVLGVVAGAVVGTVITSSSNDNFGSTGSKFYKVSGAAGLGVLLGAMIGASIKSDRWIEISNSSLRISHMNTFDSTIGLTLTLPF